jgi:hypothetical protein
VENSVGADSGVAAVLLDDKLMTARSFPLLDDGQTHQVRVVLGPHDKNVNELSAVLSSEGG